MFSLALKNILHYKGRSITTFVLSFFSALLFIVYVALMDGSHESMLENSLNVYTGPAEVMQKGYREEKSYDYLIEDVSGVRERIAGTEGVTAIAARLESFALLSTQNDSVGAMVVGIEPRQEAKVSRLKEALKAGRYLTEGDTNALYIGEELSKRLKVKVGDKLALIGTATDYSFAAERFTVCGVFKTGLFEFDSTSAFVNKPYFDDLMMSKNRASYLVIGVEKLDETERVVSKLNAKLDSGYEAVSWRILMSDLVQAMEVDSIFGYVSLALFLIVIFFVVMIYGFINITVRTRELGLLRAIGLRPAQLTGLLLTETLILALSSVLIATLLGGYIAYYFELHPIVIEGIAETYRDYGYVSDEIPTRFDLFTIGWNAAVVFALNIIAIVYPVIYINRYTPMEAIRHV